MIPLTADYVARVVLQEAVAAGATPTGVLDMKNDPFSKRARAAALRRIARETGASAHRLAKVWGCDPSAVSRYLRDPDAAPRPALRLADNIQAAPGEGVDVTSALTTFAAIDRMRGGA